MPTWVVVFENLGGKPGNALGAKMVFPGDTSGTVDLLRGTTAGQSYFVGEYVEAFRAAGLKVGLYYSLADWRIPAYFAGPESDAESFENFIADVHAQVAELLSGYGKIDVIWFDGAWPHTAAQWRSAELVKMIRTLQPEILINNRLDRGAQDPHDHRRRHIG